MARVGRGAVDGFPRQVPAARPVLTAKRRAQLGRRAQLLAGASVAYNTVEAVVAIAAGAAASSIALIGFGLDSVVEMSSGLIILWQFRHTIPEERERTALRAIALAFFALATYVAIESGRALVAGDVSEASTEESPLLWCRSSSCRSCPRRSDGPAGSSGRPPSSWTPSRRCCVETCCSPHAYRGIVVFPTVFGAPRLRETHRTPARKCPSSLN